MRPRANHRRSNRLETTARPRADRGAVLPITALILTALITTTAFAIDLGRLRSERRSLQADADAIALDTAQVIPGLTIAVAQPLAVAEANLSAARNDLDITLTDAEVQVGQWNVQTQTLETNASEPVDAVEIRLDSTLPMYFDLSSDDRSVNRRSVAFVQAQTKGSIGGVFSGIQTYNAGDTCEQRAELDAQMSFMNELYSEFFGMVVPGGTGPAPDTGTVPCTVTGPDDGLQLDAASWQGLAFGNVNLADVAALMGFGSVDSMMDSQVNARDFYTASATAMQSSGDAADVTAGGVLASFSGDIDASRTITMDDLASGSVGNGESAADTRVNALGLLSAGAQAINGNNFITADLPIDLPYSGTTVTPRISVIEPPTFDVQWRNAGDGGPSNSQIKIGFEIPLTDVELDFGVLGGVLAPLAVDTTTGSLAVVIEVASAATTHEAVDCSPDLAFAPHRSTMRAETGAVTISIGTVTDAELQQSGDVTVNPTPILNGVFGTLLPLPPDIDLDAVTDVSQTYTYDAGVAYSGGYDANVGLLGATESHEFDVTQVDALPAFPGPSDPYRYNGGMTGSTITDHSYGNLTYNTDAGLLALLAVANTDITNFIADAIEPVTDEIVDELIDPLLTALGVTAGGADGHILEVRCQVPALANRD